MTARLTFLLSRRWVRICAAILSALLTALSVCFSALGVLEWVSLVPAVLLLLNAAEDGGASFWRGYRKGFGFFMVYYAVIFHWFFYMYPLEFLGLSPVAAAVVVVVACLGLAFLQSVVGAFTVPLFFLLSRGRLVKRHRWLMPLILAALWCVMEWALTLTWAGVPWSRLALGQTGMRAVIGTASLFGSYFITLLIVAVNGLLAYGLYYHRRTASACALLLFAANLTVGAILLDMPQEATDTLRVAAVQGNISSEDKWKDDKLIDSLAVHTVLTQEAAGQGAALILWPESVVPYNINEMESVDSYLRKVAVSTDTHLLVGGFWRQEGRDYNAVYAYAPDGSLNETAYFKRHLVPFGEFLPLEGLVRAVIPPLAELNAFKNTLEPGRDSNIIRTEVGDIGCLICFDSIYEESVRQSVADGAELIALSTNDSWFADSAALYMHNRQAVLRAVENGRYVVRSANTGISSIITPKGEILDSVGAGREGIAVADVGLCRQLTLYTRMGNVTVYLAVGFLMFLLAYAVTDKRLTRKGS